jgi:dihydropteroate synthase
MPAPIAFRSAVLDWTRPYVMGVVNVTPDSFSDGGAFLGVDAAVEHGVRMAGEGADLLDVGGEATNPRAIPVSAEEELRRVVPVVERLAARVRTPISVDTTKAAVARAAVAAGAELVNDVSGGLFDPELPRAAAELGAAYICGHLRGRTIAEVFAREAGPPPTPAEVEDELAARLDAVPAALRPRTLVDPGLGFGKGADPAANVGLIRGAGGLGARTGAAVVLGPSRKRFLARLIQRDPHDAGVAPPGGAAPDPVTRGRLDAASVGACLAGVAAGANVLRVHDPGLLRAALVVYFEIRGS